MSLPHHTAPEPSQPRTSAMAGVPHFAPSHRKTAAEGQNDKSGPGASIKENRGRPRQVTASVRGNNPATPLGEVLDLGG